MVYLKLKKKNYFIQNTITQYGKVDRRAVVKKKKTGLYID